MAAAIVVGALLLGGAQAPAAVTTSTLGVYRGGGAATAAAAYGTWLGRSVGWVEDFLPRDSWSKIEEPGWITSAWRSTPYRLTLSVPMLPDTGGTLEAGAAGDYDTHFTKLAQALVAQGYANATLRIGWEFNGGWYRWSAEGKEAAFAAYWRHIVNAMRAVPGQQFTFDFCPSMGSVNADVAASYPGDAYVDYVGLDAYDQDWGSGWDVPTTRWQHILSMSYGLQWQRTFAAAHGKPMTLPEWGLFTRPDGHGGGDDPYYIRQMHDWIAANDYAYTIYFEFDAPDGEHELMGGHYPNSAPVFRQLFGGQSATPTPPAPAPAAPSASAPPASGGGSSTAPVGPVAPPASPLPAGSPAPAPASPTRAIPVSTLGVYRGGAATRAVAEYQSWLGHPIGWVQDYLPRDSWSKIEHSGWITSAWRATPYRLTLTVPMLPDTGGSLENGADGRYDGHFTRLAHALVAGGFADATLRLGPEFNGDWYRWSAHGEEAAFAGYWRQIVRTVRAVPGQKFTFDWTASLGAEKADVAQSYPGNAYVDYVGLDLYDQDWQPGWDVPATRWQHLLTATYGLRWQKDFATAHHKRMTLPEWGVFTRTDGHGGGDDPYFIQQMYNWIANNDYAYAIYFEFDAPDGRHALMSGNFPRSAGAFKETFGAHALAVKRPKASVRSKPGSKPPRVAVSRRATARPGARSTRRADRQSRVGARAARRTGRRAPAA